MIITSILPITEESVTEMSKLKSSLTAHRGSMGCILRGVSKLFVVDLPTRDRGGKCTAHLDTS
jgi:hypothetical protein